MRVLCVAEKPSIAKSISQILSGGQYTMHNTDIGYIKNYEFAYPQTNSFYIVTCVAGHLTTCDFTDAHRKWHSCEAVELFDAPVVTMIGEGKGAIERNLVSQARNAQMLMIWTDCDREGEHIGLEVLRACQKSNRNIRVKRARFSAIIAQQIHRAAQNPVELDLAQAEAVEARIILDLKAGAAFTRMQTKILQARIGQLAEAKDVISYGSCQFPTLGFIVQKYKLAQDFVSEKFWYIYLSLCPNGSSGEETVFTWKRGHLFDQEIAISLYSLVLSNTTTRVINVTNKTTKKWKPLPLTTVELQKSGSRLLRLSPKKLLDIAEKLYQQGFVSYPRTETDQFDPQFDFTSLIRKQTVDPAWGAFATSLDQGGFSVPRKGKHNDEAHPPIHPTAHAGNLVGDEKKVYEFITRRFLACCSKDAEGWLTTVNVVCGFEEFSASGLVVTQRNYLDVYPYDKWVGHVIPEFEEGEEFQPSVCELREGQTTKPTLLTEADLVTLMDKNGIGTDATIAQHIEMVINRGYVLERMEGATKYLVPTTLGIGLIEGYNQVGLNASMTKPQLRRETERKMVQVCQRTTTKDEFLRQTLEQYKQMFVITKREFDKVVTSVREYLEGVPGDQNNDDDGGGGGGGDEGGDGNDGQGRGRGRGRGQGQGQGRGRGGRGGSRGTRGGKGAGTTRGRGGGRGGAPAGRPRDDDSDADDSQLPPPQPIATPQSSSSTASSSGQGSTSTSYAPTLSSRSTTSTPASSSGQMWPANNINGVKCNCGNLAVKKAITKSSNRQGSFYWSCASCNFFQLADDSTTVNQPDTPGTTVPTKRSNPTDSNTAARKCKCNMAAKQLTVTKEGSNRGRRFWVCATPTDAPTNHCDSFEWDDEPPRQEQRTGGMSSRTFSGNAGGAQPTADKCYKCNQPGHWASACPTDGEVGNKRPRSFGSSANSGATNATCYKCQKPGHFSTNCPSGAGPSKAKSGESADVCYKCGGTGHWSNDCETAGGSRTPAPAKRGRGSGKAKRGRGGRKKFQAADGR